MHLIENTEFGAN